MGSYLSVNIDFPSATAVDEALAPLVSVPAVRLIGGASVDRTKSGDHWLFAGHGVEHFLLQYLGRGSGEIRSINFLGPKSDYFDCLTGFVSSQHIPEDAMSPLEIMSQDSLATILDAEPLSESIVRDFGRWLTPRPQAFCILFVTIPLARKAQHGGVLENAFRFLRPSHPVGLSMAAPFLIVKMRSRPKSDNTVNIDVFSESRIWLYGNLVKDRIGEPEADANLRCFATIVQYLSRGPNRSVTLHLDSKTFFDEEQRIKSTLAQQVPDIVYERW